MDNDPVPITTPFNLYLHVRKFIEEQQITCPETIAQCDRVIINAYEFIQGCCDIVGYYEYPDDEQ